MTAAVLSLEAFTACKGKTPGQDVKADLARPGIDNLPHVEVVKIFGGIVFL